MYFLSNVSEKLNAGIFTKHTDPVRYEEVIFSLAAQGLTRQTKKAIRTLKRNKYASIIDYIRLTCIDMGMEFQGFTKLTEDQRASILKKCDGVVEMCHNAGVGVKIEVKDAIGASMRMGTAGYPAHIQANFWSLAL